jgi:hypothetical protein
VFGWYWASGDESRAGVGVLRISGGTAESTERTEEAEGSTVWEDRWVKMLKQMGEEFAARGGDRPGHPLRLSVPFPGRR